ncbi:hypothetical protein [Paenibacillus terrae]|uniref:hypothetical protein n=1 Tax=Paenibacillus terrae TaxID=159743 RepID=UPI000697F41E|nr:hypothetical protein [Paenibacillus terrae]
MHEKYVPELRKDNKPAGFIEYAPGEQAWRAVHADGYEGLTILRTHQCPYLEVATQNIIEAAEKVGVQPKIMHIQDRSQLMELSPTPYGVFHVICNGELISYHRLTARSFAKNLSMLYAKS